MHVLRVQHLNQISLNIGQHKAFLLKNEFSLHHGHFGFTNFLFLCVCDFRFGLFEAMSAIEMMDPKMDAGMLCNKAKKVLQFEPAVKASCMC